MHKIESSLSTRAGAARGRRGVRAWLRNRAAVPATSPAPVSTPINPTVRVGSERGGAIVPTCPRRPRPSARSERHPRRGVDEKMQKREWNDAVSLSREIILSPMNRPGSPRGERQWAGNAALPTDSAAHASPHVGRLPTARFKHCRLERRVALPAYCYWLCSYAVDLCAVVNAMDTRTRSVTTGPPQQ